MDGRSIAIHRRETAKSATSPSGFWLTKWSPWFGRSGIPRSGSFPYGEREMAKKESIVRASADEIARRIARGEDRTDWKRVKAMSQAEVERLADEEDGPL